MILVSGKSVVPVRNGLPSTLPVRTTEASLPITAAPSVAARLADRADEERGRCSVGIAATVGGADEMGLRLLRP